jgi:HK97 family phage major capsid protein
MTPINDVSNALQEVARTRRGAELLRRESVAAFRAAMAREAELRQSEDGFASALDASGHGDWTRAPHARAVSDRLAAQYGRTPRTFNSFFVEAGLSRALTAASAGGAAELVGIAAPLTIEAARPSNSFLDLCTIARPGPNGDVMIGKLSTAPGVTIMANESASSAEQSPEATQSLLAPVNLTTYVVESRQFNLQTGAMGANAIRDLIVGALRTQAQVQILTGTGSNGQVLGLCNDGTIATDTGGTLAFAKVAAAMEDVEAGAGDGELAWVCTAPAAKVLRSREIASGSGPILADGRIGGYRCIVVGGTTDAVAAFGRWRDLLAFEWAPVEIAVNPFANFQGQRIGVRGWLTFNAAPKVAGSFSTITAIT